MYVTFLKESNQLTINKPTKKAEDVISTSGWLNAVSLWNVIESQNDLISLSHHDTFIC